ncbi:hypothetical protein ACHWQZ_G012798 [Mnemiopsis leidyi]
MSTLKKSLTELSADLETRWLVSEPKETPGEDTSALLERIQLEIPVALAFHRVLEECEETPLVDLGAMEKVGRVFLKDEGQRMGMKAFKVLGGTYALHRLEVRGDLQEGDTVTTFTDGNHGAGLAYAARQAGYRAVIFVPKVMVKSRRDRIEEQGAELIEVDGDYDTTVAEVMRVAKEKGWVLVGDTSWEGYEQVPRDITTAYSTIFAEALCQMKEEHGLEPTHVILQAGVGSFAAGGIAYCLEEQEPPPRFVCVEPTDADCIYENVRVGGDGKLACQGQTESVSAGLNCGIPAYKTAWPILRDHCSAYVALGDGWPIAAVRELHKHGVISGESGCCGYAVLMAARKDDQMREDLKLNDQSVVLVVNTEAATDPDFFDEIIG